MVFIATTEARKGHVGASGKSSERNASETATCISIHATRTLMRRNAARGSWQQPSTSSYNGRRFHVRHFYRSLPRKHDSHEIHEIHNLLGPWRIFYRFCTFRKFSCDRNH